jgi:hypothetical protein
MKRIRNSKCTYRLIVDPERIELTDSIASWILDILIKAGGTVSRPEMVDKFTKVLKRRRPDLAVRPTSVLSTQQRILKDRGIIQITDSKGRPIPTRLRTLVKAVA